MSNLVSRVLLDPSDGLEKQHIPVIQKLLSASDHHNLRRCINILNRGKLKRATVVLSSNHTTMEDVTVAIVGTGKSVMCLFAIGLLTLVRFQAQRDSLRSRVCGKKALMLLLLNEGRLLGGFGRIVTILSIRRRWMIRRPTLASLWSVLCTAY